MPVFPCSRETASLARSLDDKLPAPLPLFPHMLHAITKVTKVAQKASKTLSGEEGSVSMPRRAPLMVLH